MSFSTSNSLNEDLSQYSVYVCIYADCPNPGKAREEVILEVLADCGATLRVKVVNTPRFSKEHGYKKGEIYEIAKQQVHSHTRSLKSLTSAQKDGSADFIMG